MVNEKRANAQINMNDVYIQKYDNISDYFTEKDARLESEHIGVLQIL